MADAQKRDQSNEAAEGQTGPQPLQFTVPSLPPLPSLSYLPPITIEPKRLLWLGGLAALGVAGLVEWPVVAAIGVGSYVAERFAREHREHREGR